MGNRQEENAEYSLGNEIELTEGELENLEIPEEAKYMFRFFMEHNTEKQVIKICPGHDNCISLHGAEDVKNFIKAIQDYSREVFEP